MTMWRQKVMTRVSRSKIKDGQKKIIFIVNRGLKYGVQRHTLLEECVCNGGVCLQLIMQRRPDFVATLQSGAFIGRRNKIQEVYKIQYNMNTRLP
jgi:hypothetical protein